MKFMHKTYVYQSNYFPRSVHHSVVTHLLAFFYLGVTLSPRVAFNLSIHSCGTHIFHPHLTLPQ